VSNTEGLQQRVVSQLSGKQCGNYEGPGLVPGYNSWLLLLAAAELKLGKKLHPSHPAVKPGHIVILCSREKLKNNLGQFVIPVEIQHHSCLGA